MRKIVFLCSLFLIGVLNSLVAQGNDSLTVNLSELQVTAAQKKLYSEMGRILTVIDKSEIKRSAVQSIDQLLDYVAGIDIRQRGTNSTQADISVRGGTFDQVLVLLNGVNITDPQTGHFNLDIPLNLSDVSRIEILEGSSARVLGPNAFSGAINIVTENSDKQSLTAELTGGSFVTLGQALSGNFVIDKVQTFASISHNSSNGYMDNTDFNFLNGFIHSSLQTEKAGKFELQLAGQMKDFGANSFYTLAYPNQFESTKTFMAALSWSLTRGNWQYNAQTFWRQHHDRFELFRNYVGAASWYKFHNYHMTDVTGGKASATYSSVIGKTTVGIEIHNEHIFSNVLGAPIDSMRAPLETNGYFTKENNRLIETGMIDHSIKLGKWFFSAGAAATNSTTFGLNGYGGVDAAYSFSDNFKIFADANSAVRFPTFTDLYYKSKTQLANPNLQPEKSQTVEFGTKIYQDNWKLDVAIFYRMGQNVIDWVRIPPAIAKTANDTLWQSKNLTNVNALGGDISFAYFFHKGPIKKLGLLYSYLQMDKSADTYDSKYVLDYLKNKISLTVDHAIWKKLSASWKLAYFDRAGTYTDAKSVLQSFKPYALLDTRFLWADKTFDVFVDVNNILNTSYADYGGLTQPGINFSVGVRKRL
ncbi:MAG: TonB-dependent receptor [Paludibacter sp.]